MIVCEICSKESVSQKSLGLHISRIHKNVKEYYDQFILKNIIPLCNTCNGEVKFKGFTQGYFKFCNIKCVNNNPEVKRKKKETCLKNYGVENPSFSKEIKSKMRETCLKNYGVENPSFSKEIKEKKKETCLKNYGVDNPFKSENIRDKSKKTWFKKYNVNNPSQAIEIKEKKKKTCLKNYGVEYSSQSDIVKEKKVKTCLEKYNIPYIFQIGEFKEKIKNTCIEKYGVDHPLKSKEVKEKIKNTCLIRYGVDHPLKSKEVKEKIKNTCIEKYGVDNPFESKEVKEKIKNTCIEKYGVDNPFKSKEVKEKIKKVWIEKLLFVLSKFEIRLLDDDFKHSFFIHKWLCLNCDIVFKAQWSNIYQGYRCPTCFPKIHGISKSETEIFDFVKSLLNLNTEIIQSDRKAILPQELDIYIPSKNIAIEFNGLYWHSEEMLCDKNYHLNKTELCKKQKIKLIHIFEDEWLFKKDIVKSRLRNILNIKSENKIFARECIIKEIESKEKNEFLEHNHIQGKDNSVIKLGSFYQDELISTMTFSKGNISKGSKPIEGVWELNRFCSKLNYQTTGMASKLLSHFKKNYIWKEIFSYADRRWSDGNVYEKLGFESSRITKPNYWYVKGLKRIHRFNLRKRPDEPKDIPEWILRQQEGYSKIWDCGNLKFLMIN